MTLGGCSVSKSFDIRYANDVSVFTQAPENAKAGEIVNLRVADEYASGFTLLIDGVQLEHAEDDELLYSFTMPEKEIEVDYIISETKEKVLLADYYERVVGTPMEMPYEEVVLYTYSDTQLLIEHWENGGTPAEKVGGYLVPISVYDDVLQVIEKYEMEGWNDREDAYPITGALYVCRFVNKDQFYRVSSEKMPDNGDEAFRAFASVLYGNIDPKQLLYEENTGKGKYESSVIENYGQLSEYLEKTPLRKEDLPKYFSYENKVNEDGEYQLILYCLNGYYFAEDTALDISYLIKYDYTQEQLDEIYAEYIKEYDEETIQEILQEARDGEHFDDRITGHNQWIIEDGQAHMIAMNSDEKCTYQDVEYNGFSGYLYSFSIPEEYLFEDEYGPYFLFSEGRKCYLSGASADALTGELMPDWSWIKEAIHAIES